MENKTMTPQQALTEIIHFCRGNVEALKIAEEAIEKQIPKKPESNHHCPVCGWSLPVPQITSDYCSCCYYPNFCNDCGQAIDWSDEE